MSGPHPRRDYELTIRQEPKQARMCGVGGKADRRPIDPPPIVQLRVIDPPVDPNDPHSGHDPTAFLQNPYYFMFACLAKPDDDTELHWLKDGRTKCTTGSVVSSLYHLRDAESADNADVGFFVFPDLSVRTEGSYRLKLSLYEIVGNSVRHCKSIFSAPFYVFTAKKFPGMEESTPLSCSLADQGIKIRIRKDIRSRKRPPPQNVQLMSVGAGDGGGSSLDRQLPVEPEPASPVSCASSPDLGIRSGKRRKMHNQEELQPEAEQTTHLPPPQSRWGSVSADSEGASVIPPPPGASRSETPPGPQILPAGAPQVEPQASVSGTSMNPPTPTTGPSSGHPRINAWYAPPPPPPAPPAPPPSAPVAQTAYDSPNQPPPGPPPQGYYYQAPPHPPPPQYPYPYTPYAPNNAPPPQHSSWGYDPYYNAHHGHHPAAPHHPHPHAPPPMPPYGYHPQSYPPPYYDSHSHPHPHYHAPSHHHPHAYPYEYGAPPPPPQQPQMAGPPASPPPTTKENESQPSSRGADPQSVPHSSNAAPPYSTHPGSRPYHPYYPPPPSMPTSAPGHWYGQHSAHPSPALGQPPHQPQPGHPHPPPPAPPAQTSVPPPPPPPSASASHLGHSAYQAPPPSNSSLWDSGGGGGSHANNESYNRSRSPPPPHAHGYYHKNTSNTSVDGPIQLAPMRSHTEPSSHDGNGISSSGISGFGHSGTRLPAPLNTSGVYRGSGGYGGGGGSGTEGRAKLDIRNIVDDRRDDDES
ncbi:velvet factor-domain-containing protein [Pterulicium gracile]|uniref:Velvet factor-domain-containing protein n=1 Tax=Pterulicium gracile TaxID=1884261 RepID=A0A5C3QDV4_9AGAR|nr:velvet factor-domain-containing protein [Pterula gracilis]